MKLQIQIRGRTREVEIIRESGAETSGRARPLWLLDGERVAADAVEVAPGVYSILIEGQVVEVTVESGADGLSLHAAGRRFSAEVRDPRQWRRKRAGALVTAGRQQVSAPMPGKVVRVLVKQGERVEAGQGLLVVEAMKMQNEIRAPKSGTLERLFAAEGQAVNAGEVLAIVA